MRNRDVVNRSRYLHVVLFFSGIAGLGYEILWVRMFSTGLGHEVPSLLAVIAAFFMGLSLGAWALDGRVSRSARPDLWYVACEVAIGVWALVSMVSIPMANRHLPAWIGATPAPLWHGCLAFLAPFVLLLPSTVCMGATLPAIDRMLRHERRVASLYAANTLGAMAGTLGVTFLLVPTIGFRLALLSLAALNLLCALAVVYAPRAEGGGDSNGTDEIVAETRRGRGLAVPLIVTGFLGIGYEVIAVRVMAQVLENTVYSFASALAMYLLATAIGAALLQRWPGSDFERRLGLLLTALSTTICIGILILAASRQLHDLVRAATGPVAAEVVLAIAVFLAPVTVMGATFAHLAEGAKTPHGGVGRALAANTVGGAAAPLFFGVLLLPEAGARTTLLLVALGYVILAVYAGGAARRRLSFIAPALGLIAVLSMPSDLALVRPAPGGSVLEYRQGAMAAAAILEDDRGRRSLKVNDHFSMGGEASAYSEVRQAHIPLLLHPSPRTALFLGLGSGITFAATAQHPDLDATAVELVPEVIELSSWFSRTIEPLTGGAPLDVVAADARRFVQATTREYDVVVADLFHPARDGSGNLYTREHFSAVRERLAPSGLFCQWLPIHQLDSELMRIIMRTFLEVFPESDAYLLQFNVETPALALVGYTTPIEHTEGWMARRAVPPSLYRQLRDCELLTDLDLFGLRVAGARSLAGLAGDGPSSTDDWPVVVFEAPGVLFRETTSTESLTKLLDSAKGYGPGERLARYQRARDIYLRAELSRVADDLAAATRGYLESASLSTDFTHGYAMALLLARDMPQTQARELLTALSEAAPHRPEASAALQRLQGR